MIHRQDRRGFALPAAIGALVIVGVLVTAGFYVARQELRIGAASRFSAMALDLAQSEINNVVINETSALTALSTWGDTTLVDTTTDGIVSVTATRLAMRLFFLNAKATVTQGGAMWSGATRQIGVVTRLTSANMDPPGALATQGSLTVGGSTIVDGYDSVPSAWGASQCDTSSVTNKPGIVINNSDSIKTSGSGFVIDGSPQIQQDTTITTSSLLTFGDMSWSDVAAMAEKTYPGPSAGPYSDFAPDSTLYNGTYRCDTSVLDNWGDPYHPSGACGNYFPIIYAAGDLKITGGYGQGILLVGGDLSVQGGFEFYGPVFVKGELTTQGTGGHFNGGVVAANVNLGSSTVLGNAVVSYSSCAIQRAVINNSALTKVRPLAERSWVDLSNVLN